MRKLEKCEEFLVDKTEHQSVPDWRRSADRKHVWASLLRFWD